MEISHVANSLEGYRFRDELVEKLLPHMKDRIDKKFMNKLVRGYVPTFFATHFPPTNTAPWLFPFPPLRINKTSKNRWWVEEIEAIGAEFAKKSSLDHKSVKKIFKKYCWNVEEPVKGISLIDKRGRWKYDAYKDRVAVEVELSNRVSVFKDTFKFLIGQQMDQIDLGIIMVRRYLQKEKKWRPHLKSVERDWHAIYNSLPMVDIAYYGFPNAPSPLS